MQQDKLKSTHVHPNLQRERDQLDFNQRQLSVLIWGGEEKLQKHLETMKIFAADPHLRNTPAIYDMTREETFVEAYKRLNRMKEIGSLDELNVSNILYYTLVNRNIVATSLHHGMFELAIRYLGSDEQIEKWLPLTLKNQIIGNYGQTEIGHGSNVRGLETQAVFDPTTDEFILNTPKPSSTKFWPGDLGLTSTHSVIYAQLVINGKKLGVQSFIVPIRDRNTHMPLDGVEVGDIGPKFGFRAKDNGYLILKDVRIPRTNMLMRYVNVDKNGEISLQGNPKVLYSVMMTTRLQLITGSMHSLGHALIIGIRYGLVRSQFKNVLENNKLVERQIIDYQTHLLKLAPLLSFNHAIVLTQIELNILYNKMLNNIEKNQDFSLLGPMHTILSGLKALICNNSYEGLKTIREACGAAGFSNLAGIESDIQYLSAYVTLEGDAVVMYLQTARSILKNGRKVLTLGKVINKQIEYLSELPLVLTKDSDIKCKAENPDYFRDDKNLLELLKFSALYRIGKCLVDFSSSKYKQYTLWEKFYETFQVDLVKMSQSHSYFMLGQYFLKGIQRLDHTTDKNLVKHLRTMYRIFCYTSLLKDGASLGATRHLTPQHFQMIQELLLEDCLLLRPQMLNLAEAFEFDDNVINSAIGSYDGNVYERLFDWAQATKLNNKNKIDGFDQYLKPFLAHKL